MMRRGTTYTPYIQTMEAGRWDSLWLRRSLPAAVGRLPCAREREAGTAFDGFTLIAVAAGMTQKLKLGGLVMGNTYRNPALVAKMATTLDQASKGRFILGIGAAWFKREHEAYGWDFPSMRERSDRFQEACELTASSLPPPAPSTTTATVLPARPCAAIARLLSRAAYSNHGRRHRGTPHAAHPGHARRASSSVNGWETRNLPDGMSVESYRHKHRRVGEALRGRWSRSGRDQRHDTHAIEPHGRQGICEALPLKPSAPGPWQGRETTS